METSREATPVLEVLPLCGHTQAHARQTTSYAIHKAKADSTKAWRVAQHAVVVFIASRLLFG